MNAHAAWAQPQLAAQVLQPRRDGCSEIALRVDALDDARQVLWLEQRIRALPGVRRVAIDRPARRVRVVWDTRLTSLPTLLDRHYPGDVVDLTWIDRSGATRTGKAVLTPGS